MSSNVLPRFAFENSPNGCSLHVHSFGDFSLQHALSAQPPNLSDIILRKLRVAHAFTVGMSLLLVHIFHVICLSAQKEVMWINARWVIQSTRTIVADLKSRRDSAVVKFVANAMSIVVLAAKAKDTIATNVDCALPKPAFIWIAFLTETPKHIGQRDSDSTPCAMPREVVSRYAIDVLVNGRTLWRNLGLVAASALAISVGDFQRRIAGRGCKQWQLWGMLLHDIGSMKAGVQARSAREALPGIFAWSYRSIIAHLHEWGNMHGRDLLKAVGA